MGDDADHVGHAVHHEEVLAKAQQRGAGQQRVEWRAVDGGEFGAVGERQQRDAKVGRGTDGHTATHRPKPSYQPAVNRVSRRFLGCQRKVVKVVKESQ